MTEAVVITIESSNPRDTTGLVAVLLRVFPAAVTFRTHQAAGLQVAIPVEAIREEAPDDQDEDLDQAVLAHLLYTGASNCAGEQYADILYRLHRGEGTEGDTRVLEAGGLRYFKRGGETEARAFLAVSRGHPAIETAFNNSPWRGNPFARIARVARAEDGVLATADGARRRHILIPMDLVAELAPEVPY